MKTHASSNKKKTLTVHTDAKMRKDEDGTKGYFLIIETCKAGGM